MGVLRARLMPINIITNLVSKAVGGATGENGKPPPLKAPKKPGKAATLQDAAKMRRERNSSKPYGWLRKVRGRNYKVYNLDTRDPQEFKQATNMMGKSLARKVR